MKLEILQINVIECHIVHHLYSNENRCQFKMLLINKFSLEKFSWNQYIICQNNEEFESDNDHGNPLVNIYLIDSFV